MHTAAGDKDLWFPMCDGASGALLQLKKSVLCTFRLQEDEVLEQIVKFNPDRLILTCNHLDDVNIWHYMTFFKFFWKNRNKINCPLYMYVPERSFIWGMKKTDVLKDENFKRFVWHKTDLVKFPNWKKYLNYQSNVTIPMWDFTADKFDFFEFYDFLCKRLAYIEKRMRLFPQLESGMSYGNLQDWLDTKDQEFIFRCGLCRESRLGTDSTRLWKLLDQKSIETVMKEIKWNKFSNNNTFFELACVDLDSVLDHMIPKNILAKKIFRKGDGKEFRFLFPMPLFLGYYARQGKVGCYIPEYNFHEIIAALCNILKNKPCPELLPDIPDEPEISLEAYRNGYIRLAPRCKKGEVAASVCPEYKINMMLWDGGTLRKMTVQEILLDSAERILHYFDHSKNALKYLHKLSRKFKDRYNRVSIVK